MKPSGLIPGEGTNTEQRMIARTAQDRIAGDESAKSNTMSKGTERYYQWRHGTPVPQGATAQVVLAPAKIKREVTGAMTLYPVNFVSDLQATINSQEQTIKSLVEVAKCTFSSVDDKSKPSFLRAVECFNGLWEEGSI